MHGYFFYVAHSDTHSTNIGRPVS